MSDTPSTATVRGYCFAAATGREFCACQCKECEDNERYRPASEMEVKAESPNRQRLGEATAPSLPSAARRTWTCYKNGLETVSACVTCDCLQGMPATRTPSSAAEPKPEIVERARHWALSANEVEEYPRAAFQEFRDEILRLSRIPSANEVMIAKSFARRVERHLAAYGQAELDRRALADMIASTE